MSIYTRTGDTGETSLYSGERVNKSTLRVEAYGTIDELNSVLGSVSALTQSPDIQEVVGTLQDELFEAGADLATLSSSRREIRRMGRIDWERLEDLIDRFQKRLPALKHFVLPAGSGAACQIHFARAVCRRSERLICRLEQQEGDVNPDLLIYVNRLSDLLFVLARYENQEAGEQEIIWVPK